MKQPLLTKPLTKIMAGAVGVGFATAAAAVGVGAGVNADTDAETRVTAWGTPLAGSAADAHLDAYVSANTQWRDGAAAGGSRAAARVGANGDGLAQATAAELEVAGSAAAQAKRSAPR